jgi:hypothetical protein
MRTAAIFSLLVGVASEALAQVKVVVTTSPCVSTSLLNTCPKVNMPEPGTIPTLAVYLAGLGLFVWYVQKRSNRSNV